MFRICIYKGYGMYESDGRILYRVLSKYVCSKKYSVSYVSPEDILSGALNNETSLFVIGGGFDLGLIKVLGPKGMAKIRSYVTNGGSYLGMCSGAYFACDYIEFDKGGSLEVIGERFLKFYPGHSYGPLYKPYDYQTRSGASSSSISFQPELQPCVDGLKNINGEPGQQTNLDSHENMNGVPGKQTSLDSHANTNGVPGQQTSLDSHANTNGVPGQQTSLDSHANTNGVPGEQTSLDSHANMNGVPGQQTSLDSHANTNGVPGEQTSLDSHANMNGVPGQQTSLDSHANMNGVPGEQTSKMTQFVDLFEKNGISRLFKVYFNGGGWFVGRNENTPQKIDLTAESHVDEVKNGVCENDKGWMNDEIGFENVAVLARYADLASNPAAIVKCLVDKGTAVLSGVHFEYDAIDIDDGDVLVESMIPELKQSEINRKYLILSILKDLNITTQESQ